MRDKPFLAVRYHLKACGRQVIPRGHTQLSIGGTYQVGEFEHAGHAY